MVWSTAQLLLNAINTITIYPRVSASNTYTYTVYFIMSAIESHGLISFIFSIKKKES